MLNYHSSGSGKTQIIFIHGNSQSGAAWKHLLQDKALTEAYTLIAPDLPGHGASFKSTQPQDDYSLQGLSKHTLSFIKQFENNPYILIGNSLGANIIGEIVPDLTNCKGILTMGSCAIGLGLTLEKVFQPNPNAAICFMAEHTGEQVDILIEDTVFNASVENKNLIKQEFLKADPAVRTNLAVSISTQGYSDELLNLKNSGIPLAFVLGKEERLVNINHLDGIDLPLWKDKVVLLENSGHFSQMDQPLQLAKVIAAFANDCFK